MSTAVFIAALGALIGTAVLIRRGRFFPPVLLGLIGLLAACLILMSAGVGVAAWGALVSTILIVFVLFPLGAELGDG